MKITFNGSDTLYDQLSGIWNRMKNLERTDAWATTLLLQAQISWIIFDGVLRLATEGNGLAAMILARSLFERAAAMSVLIDGGDPLLENYLDSGKLVVYDLGMHFGNADIHLIESEVRVIKARYGRTGSRKNLWHGYTTIQDMVRNSEFYKNLTTEETKNGLYETFYKESSSFAHGDSYPTLSYRAGTWKQELRDDDLKKFAEVALAMAFSFLACTLGAISQKLKIDVADEMNKLCPNLEDFLATYA